jgi:ADP-ribose pyrophosphatase YjhB (NUDIX family)
MPHIHTNPGQIDFTADVFIVYRDRVLFRYHDKHNLWLVPGGHIELNETPEMAAKREVYEEVGLLIELYQSETLPDFNQSDGGDLVSSSYQELIPPQAMNVHSITPEHRHISLVYYATSSSNEIIEPEGNERSGGCIWLTEGELIAHPDIHESMKRYGLQALALLAS